MVRAQTRRLGSADFESTCQAAAFRGTIIFAYRAADAHLLGRGVRRNSRESNKIQLTHLTLARVGSGMQPAGTVVE